MLAILATRPVRVLSEVSKGYPLLQTIHWENPGHLRGLSLINQAPLIEGRDKGVVSTWELLEPTRVHSLELFETEEGYRFWERDVYFDIDLAGDTRIISFLGWRIPLHPTPRPAGFPVSPLPLRQELQAFVRDAHWGEPKTRDWRSALDRPVLRMGESPPPPPAPLPSRFDRLV